MNLKNWFCIVLVFLACSLATALSAEDPAELQQKGVAALKDSQTNPGAIVIAARCFAKASALYEASGKPDLAVEMNSYLYWCKKKMTIRDIDEFLKGEVPSVTARLTAVENKAAVPVEAQAYMDRAEAFLRANPSEHLLAAVHFFEVADRFKDSDVGRAAMSKSLSEMQQVVAQKTSTENAKLDAYRPAATDGKVFVKSEPPGAAIFLITAGGRKLETGKFTPALVQLPVGNQIVELTLKDYRPASFRIDVDAASIVKPDALKLNPITVSVSLVFEEGWRVFVDGNVVKPVKSGTAETPCTVELPLGSHEIELGKLGFIDIRQRVEIVESGIKRAGQSPTNTFEIIAKASKGMSTLMPQLEFSPIGRWSKPGDKSAYVLEKDGTMFYTYSGGKMTGSWKIKEKNTVSLKFNGDWGGREWHATDNNTVIEDGKVLMVRQTK